MNEMFSQGGKGSTGILTNKQAVARHFGVKQSEVVYFSVGALLTGYKVIYDKVSQRAYSLPADIGSGVTAVSLSPAGVLVHSAGSVDLGALAVTREEYVTLPGSFDTGVTVNTKNELVVFTDGKYRWDGALPKEVPAGSTPASTGDIGIGAWVAIGNTALKAELKESDGVALIGGIAVELDTFANLGTNTTEEGRLVTTKTASGIYNEYAVVPNTGSTGDGVVIIDRADGKQLSLQIEDSIDVRSFYKEGMTDQQVLQSALDFAGSMAGFCEVKLTQKNLKGDPWIFTRLHIGPKTIFRGAGGWLKFADNICINPATSYYLVENFDSDDVHIKDLHIDGNQANNTQFLVADILTFGGNRCSLTNVSLVNAPDSGLMFATTKNCWVNGLYVENVRDLGIYLSAGVAGGSRNCAMSNLVFRDCAHGAMGFKRYVADIVVDNVIATNCGNGITFEGFESVTPGMNPSNITMSNIRLRDIGFGYRSVSAAERAISFDSARGIRINNLSVQNCSGVGIFFSANTSTDIFINGANLTGYAANPQIASGAPNNDGIQCNGASGFELVNVNLEGFARYSAWFLNCSAGSVVGGRWTNAQASGYSAYNGARVNATCSFTKFSPDFISGISGTDLEWFNGATGITKDTILNNATGPAKYGYQVVSGPTPVAIVTPRFIGQEVWSIGASSWWKSHGPTSSDWKQISN